MDKLFSALQRDFPDFEAQKAFEAAIPVYFVRLTVEVIEPHKLSSFQAYFLHALALGVKTQRDLAYLFGVEESDLISPGASLLKLGYIEQRQLPSEKERQIVLTDKGRQVLSESGPPPVPRRKSARFHFNALTWKPMPLEEQTWFADQMVKEGLFILPARKNDRPSLGDFTIKDVTTALSGTPAFQENTIIALLELKRAELQYIAPVTVVLLRQRQTGEERLVIYRDGLQQHQESIALQRLFEEQQLELPADAASFQEPALEIPSVLPSAAMITQIARSLVRIEYALEDLQAQLDEQEERRSTTKNERERKELAEKVAQLSEALRLKKQESEELREKLQRHHVEFLRTEQHRSYLLDALRHARKEVIIISPWMNRQACNKEFCDLVGKATERGVRIRIGYGIGREHNAAEAARNRSNVQEVKRALLQQVPKSSVPLLEMKETDGTHQKILICDDLFAIAGSFNWLSYRGERDKGYRREIGALFRDPDEVGELIKIALEVLS